MKYIKLFLLTVCLLTALLLPAAAWEQCPVHAFDYHTFPDTLIQYVGEDAFAAWYGPDQTPDENGCYEKNIYNFIHDFDIPYEVFADWYYGFSYYDTDHAPALLYSDDIAAVEKYYHRSAEIKREKQNDKFAIFGRFKWRLEENARAADDAASRAFVNAFCEDGYVSIANWSMADYIRATDITQEDLTAQLHAFLDELDSIHGNGTIPGVYHARNIDFSRLYTEEVLHGNAASSVPKHLRVHTEDALVSSHRGPESLQLPRDYEAPPTADTGLMPLLVLFAASSACMFLFCKKTTA